MEHAYIILVLILFAIVEWQHIRLQQRIVSVEGKIDKVHLALIKMLTAARRAQVSKE
jgi:hypothetical protein